MSDPTGVNDRPTSTRDEMERDRAVAHLGGTRAAVEENETTNDYVSDNGQFGVGA